MHVFLYITQLQFSKLVSKIFLLLFKRQHPVLARWSIMIYLLDLAQLLSTEDKNLCSAELNCIYKMKESIQCLRQVYLYLLNCNINFNRNVFVPTMANTYIKIAYNTRAFVFVLYVNWHPLKVSWSKVKSHLDSYNFMSSQKLSPLKWTISYLH